MNPMPASDFETAYETLATAIDSAGPEREALFLTRLALVLGHELGDIDAFQNAVKTALDGLE
ncbi:hypothetical protein LJR220_000996 [Bradyrhizobium sp. LjRoot220]|uniref:hypothetical protein n=1 Tax=Bradyrhizobium sp. LjRoot220 TaxID=3342284 RepID=UPI003ED11486